MLYNDLISFQDPHNALQMCHTTFKTSKAVFIRESRFWNTDLKHGFETRFYRRAFIRVFSRACFWLSRTAPLLRISFCAACPLAKGQTAHAFRSRSLWRHLNRVWDRCCVYKIFKTFFLEKHGFESHLFVRFKTVLNFMTTVYKIL